VSLSRGFLCGWVVCVLFLVCGVVVRRIGVGGLGWFALLGGSFFLRCRPFKSSIGCQGMRWGGVGEKYLSTTVRGQVSLRFKKMYLKKLSIN